MKKIKNIGKYEQQGPIFLHYVAFGLAQGSDSQRANGRMTNQSRDLEHGVATRRHCSEALLRLRSLIGTNITIASVVSGLPLSARLVAPDCQSKIGDEE
jgi:hypothetical protein